MIKTKNNKIKYKQIRKCRNTRPLARPPDPSVRRLRQLALKTAPAPAWNTARCQTAGEPTSSGVFTLLMSQADSSLHTERRDAGTRRCDMSGPGHG